MCYPFPLLCVFFPPSDAFVSSCKGHSLSPLVCICVCIYGWVESDTKAETEHRRCQNSVAAAPDSLPTVGVELFVSDRYEANEHTSTRVCVCFKIFRFRSDLHPCSPACPRDETHFPDLPQPESCAPSSGGHKTASGDTCMDLVAPCHSDTSPQGVLHVRTSRFRARDNCNIITHWDQARELAKGGNENDP